MPDTASATPNLAAALAAFQAQYPAVSKGDTATVPTKAGGTFSYSYANLADISEVAMPLLGRLGLAFTSKPTLLDDGKFVLAYSLLHVSGEREDGIYPLHGSTPQAIGGEITYARRYALCAVTGIAPADSDDDAQAAQQEAKDRFSAGAAFERASPAPPRGPRPANGTAVRPEQQDRPGVLSTELDPDAQHFADEAHEANNVGAVKEIHDRAVAEHKLAALITNPATGGKGGLGQFLNYRRGVLDKADKALAALESAGTALELSKEELGAEFQRLAGCSIEAATTEQLEQTAAKLQSLVPAT